MRTVDEDRHPAGERVEVALQKRALTETLSVLKQASAAWASHGCPGTSECCQLSVTKKEPWLWPTEWQALLEHLKRDQRTLPEPRADGGCPFLDAAGTRCTVYQARPFGCRTYFCHRITGPAKQPADATNALLDRLTAINIALDPGAAPRPMLQWFER